MCGIAGFFNYKTKHPASKEDLIGVLGSIRYRGPDHLGIYAAGDIAIGNVRLAIQDISTEGNQPIFNEDRSVVVVYNGEIYNSPELRDRLKAKGHSFYTRTDTEILVHLYEEYGYDMANDLNGMFAFALFDIKKKLLVLGRDRSAQKPLYIHRNKDGIFFSSELKSMFPCLDSRSLNPNAVRTFLSIGYSLEPQTILKEVDTAEPGALSIFCYDGEYVRKYWNPKIECSDMIYDLEKWKGVADAVFKKAIKRHLLSDVPITLFLSGGVDSMLISSYLSEEKTIKKAYTGSFVSQEGHDEYDFARQAGSYFGFEVERVRLDNRILSDNLEDFLSTASMPQGDYSGLAAYCMAKEVSKEYRVVLGGDGGDELFGGYPTYTFPYMSKRYSFIPKAAINGLRRFASIWFDKNEYMSAPFKLQQLSLAWGRQTVNAHFALKDFLPDPLASQILNESFFKENFFTDAAVKVFKGYYSDLTFVDDISKLSWVDYNTFLRSATIPKVERNTMLSSLEARLPYLDNEIIALGLRTHSSLKVRGMRTKLCLKSLLQDKIRGKVRLNPVKQGFSPPLAFMFENELKPWKEHWLNFKTPFFKDGFAKSLSKWRGKGWDLHRLEWNICTLSDWCYRNKLT